MEVSVPPASWRCIFAVKLSLEKETACGGEKTGRCQMRLTSITIDRRER